MLSGSENAIGLSQKLAQIIQPHAKQIQMKRHSPYNYFIFFFKPQTYKILVFLLKFTHTLHFHFFVSLFFFVEDCLQWKAICAHLHATEEFAVIVQP